MMKKLLIVAAMAILPAAASAQGIRNSRHDLSSSSTTTVKATTDGEICKFCHTPHKAQSTQLVWNHTQTATTTYTWGNDLDGNPLTKLTSGTPVSSTIRNASRRCFGCHDGTIAIGSVNNAGGGVAGTIAITVVANHTNATGNLLATSGYQIVPTAMGGHHPVSVPYAGQTGYNTLSSLAVGDSAIGNYYSVTSGAANCTSATLVCTTAPNTDGRNGKPINLIPNVVGGTTNVGIECTSCHEPHNEYGPNAYFLRVNNTTASGLCRSCHNK